MNTDKRHSFRPDIISRAVWLYYRFNLSHRDIADLLADRGSFCLVGDMAKCLNYTALKPGSGISGIRPGKTVSYPVPGKPGHPLNTHYRREYR